MTRVALVSVLLACLCVVTIAQLPMQPLRIWDDRERSRVEFRNVRKRPSARSQRPSEELTPVEHDRERRGWRIINRLTSRK